jgi:RND family efflux transporter MFP subunit
MKKKNFIIIALVILVLLGGVIAIRNSKAQSSNGQIKTSAVKQAMLTKSVQSSGKTKANKSAELKFQTSGKLVYLPFKEGDRVLQGQVVAQLDTAKLKANLRQEEQDFTAAKAASEKLYNDQGASTVESFDEKVKRTAVDATQNKAYDAVVKARQDITDATLVTPIAGIITHIDSPVVGVNITPATSTIEIVDPDSLIFEANIDEVDVGELSLGQTASIALDAFPDATFSGKISYISYSSVLSGGGATVFPVQISFDEPQKLRIGLNGDVTIETIVIPNALIVPIEAIREQDTGKFVYKKTGKTYTLVPVTTGEQNDTEIVITDGLSLGDYVVTKGFSYVSK